VSTNPSCRARFADASNKYHSSRVVYCSIFEAKCRAPQPQNERYLGRDSGNCEHVFAVENGIGLLLLLLLMYADAHNFKTAATVLWGKWKFPPLKVVRVRHPSFSGSGGKVHPIIPIGFSTMLHPTNFYPVFGSVGVSIIHFPFLREKQKQSYRIKQAGIVHTNSKIIAIIKNTPLNSSKK
jgi:hypothetical protein